MATAVKVYGADWCEDTQATRNNLDSLGVQYEYINVEEDRQGQEWVKQQNGGKQKTPTLDIQGQVLVEPDQQQLEEALRGKGLMA
jgi:glutaredoxin